MCDLEKEEEEVEDHRDKFKKLSIFFCKGQLHLNVIVISDYSLKRTHKRPIERVKTSGALSY